MSTFKINAGSSPRRSFAFLVFGAIALLSVVAAWLASSFLHRAELEAQHTGHAIQAADGQTATAANLST